jgi:hypothetical protein
VDEGLERRAGRAVSHLPIHPLHPLRRPSWQHTTQRPWAERVALPSLLLFLVSRLKAMPPSDRALVAGRQAAYLARCYSGLRDDEESGECQHSRVV